MTSLEESLLLAAGAGDAATVLEALRRGASIDAQNEFGSTPLIQASVEGHVEVVQLLLEAGASLETRSEGLGLTALHQAVSWERLEIVRLLLQAGAIVDAVDDSGGTPLMCAAARGNLGLVQALLEFGASINQRDHHGFNSWAWAADKCEDEVAQFLREKGAEQTVLGSGAGQPGVEPHGRLRARGLTPYR